MPLLSLEVEAEEYRSAPSLGGVPEPAGPADYQRSLDGVLERLRGPSPDVGVYDFGHVSCAGISDIDLLFVVPEHIGPAQCRELIEACRGQPHFYHGPMIASPALARRLGWILPGVQVRHLSGPGHLDRLDRPGPEALKEILLGLTFEASVDRWFWLKSLEAETSLDLRKAVLGMWGLRRSILQKEAMALTLTSSERAFCDELQTIRDEWSKTATFDTDGTVGLLGRAAEIAEALIREMASIASMSGNGRACPAASVSRGRITLRRCVRGQLTARRYKLQFGRRRRAYHLVDLPAEAFDFLWKLRQPDPEAWGLPANIVKRQRLVKEYHVFLERRRLSGVAVPPGILDKPSSDRLMRPVDRAVSKLILRAERKRSVEPC